MITPLDLSVEQEKALVNNKKAVRTKETRLLDFGLLEEIIPPAMFPTINDNQRKVNEL
jgi:hypothetical protein